MIVNGIAKWASVHAPNTKFEPVWTIDLYPNDAVIKVLKDAGLTVKTDSDGKQFVKIKRKVDRRDGSKNDPPEVVDAYKKPFNENIGNGSEVNVIFSIYEWNFRGRTGVGTDLKKVQVVKHVPYGDSEDFDIIGDVGVDEEDFS